MNVILLFIVIFAVALFLIMLGSIWFINFFIKKYIGEKHAVLDELTRGEVPEIWSRKYKVKCMKLKEKGRQDKLDQLKKIAVKKQLKKLNQMVTYIQRTNLVESEETRSMILADLKKRTINGGKINHMKFNKNQLFSTLFTLLCTTLSSSIGLINWFQLRDTFIDTLVYYQFDKWKMPAADHFSFIFLGISWLIFVLVVHHYYGKNVDFKGITMKFILISGCQLLILFICNAIMLLLNQSSELFSIFIVCIEFLLGCMLIAIALLNKTKRKKESEITTNV